MSSGSLAGERIHQCQPAGSVRKVSAPVLRRIQTHDVNYLPPTADSLHRWPFFEANFHPSLLSWTWMTQLPQTTGLNAGSLGWLQSSNKNGILEVPPPLAFQWVATCWTPAVAQGPTLPQREKKSTRLVMQLGGQALRTAFKGRTKVWGKENKAKRGHRLWI